MNVDRVGELAGGAFRPPTKWEGWPSGSRPTSCSTVYHQVFEDLVSAMMDDSCTVHRATACLFLAKHLERFGDHAANIGEMVYFLVEGTEVRHPNSR